MTTSQSWGTKTSLSLIILSLGQVLGVMGVVEVEESLVELYQRDGAVLVPGVFSDAWVDKVRHGIARNLAQPSQYSERLTVSGNGDFLKATRISLVSSQLYSLRVALQW